MFGLMPALRFEKSAKQAEDVLAVLMKLLRLMHPKDESAARQWEIPA